MTPLPHRLRWLLCLFTTLWLTACATPIKTMPPESESGIGPFTSFSARLIVIEPARRWQVLLDWDAPTSNQGTLRLTHAASNTVVEFRWQGADMFIRDSSNRSWRPITPAQLAAHGIVIPPARLAEILLGHMPADFHADGPDQWSGKQAGSLIRLRWYADNRKLVMTDIARGRRATLIIQ
ncbi:hypothetical protein [Mariprofundus ferrooxydans]|uniref:hypothetical protein n=1 Tax=Mariprofundus ferrooxydans TaxID=314344 RepID=UPI00036C4F52|nr:hypothetical protein [Mariprofundus ferrooxydans]